MAAVLSDYCTNDVTSTMKDGSSDVITPELSDMTLKDKCDMTNEIYCARSDDDDSSLFDDKSVTDDDGSITDDDNGPNFDYVSNFEPDYITDEEGYWSRIEPIPLAHNEEVYHIYYQDDIHDDTMCLDLLKKINCESGFIRRSRTCPHKFYTKLTGEQAAKFRGVEGILGTCPGSDYYIDD